jgi:hypothetical protein
MSSTSTAGTTHTSLRTVEFLVGRASVESPQVSKIMWVILEKEFGGACSCQSLPCHILECSCHVDNDRWSSSIAAFGFFPFSSVESHHYVMVDFLSFAHYSLSSLSFSHYKYIYIIFLQAHHL